LAALEQFAQAIFRLPYLAEQAFYNALRPTNRLGNF
jgi:hypothetical protein